MIEPKRLAATAIPETWGSDAPLVSLGPWVTLYARRADWQGRIIERAPDPFEGDDAAHQALRRCQRAYAELLPALARRLDDIHGVRRDARYWNILIGPWLLRYLEIVLDRKLRLDAAFGAHPALDAAVLSTDDFVTPRDTMDLQRLVFGDAYNLQVVSELLSRQGRAFPALRLPERFRPGPAPAARQPGRALLDRAARLHAPPVLVTEIFATRRDQVRLLAALRGKAGLFLGRGLPEPPALDLQARKKLEGLAAGSEDARLAAALLPQHLPTAYFEGYASSRRAALAGWRRPPRAIVSSTGWIFNEALKFAGAEFAQQGARLFGVQHGGGYGTVLDSPTEWSERLAADAFLTWGWDDGSKAKPLPNPTAAALRRRGAVPGARDGRALRLVCEGFGLYPFHFYSFPFGAEIERDIERQFEFIERLGGAARRALVTRVHPLERGWRLRERYLERFPGLALDEARRPLPELFGETRLLVVNQIGTAFLEALAYGLPCLVALPGRFARVREKAKADVELLREAGILVDSPETAARRAEAVYDDPASWWDSPRVREVRSLWERRYAGLADDWLSPWKAFLEEEAR